MGKKLGNFIYLSGFDFFVKSLDNHLAQAFAGTHNVGGIDRFVCRNEDKTLASVCHGRIGCFIGSNRIVFDSFVGTVFH